MNTLALINLFFAGLLAGVETVVRFGVRGPLAALPDLPHLQLRQGLIKTLRVLVPTIYVPAFLTGIAVAVTGDRITPWIGVAAMTIWTLTTFTGTVPLNQALADWNPEAPPANWRAVITKWERLDTIRTAAAVAAFTLFLTA